jgi:hypothetical protein
MTKQFLTATLALLYFTGSAGAQIATADILGTVTDASSAALHAAKVTLINLDTNIERQTQSNESGEFVFNLLPPVPTRSASRRPASRLSASLELCWSWATAPASMRACNWAKPLSQ